MSKRRVCLIWLLLIMVIICCLIHTSLGQEDDSLNISYSSSLSAKSEVSHEDILNHAQSSLDMSITIHNQVIIVMGLLVALITLIVAMVGISGYFRNRQLEEYIVQAKRSAEETKWYEAEAKKAAETIKPIVEWLKEEQEEARDRLGEKTKQFPSVSEPFSEDQKKILDEYRKTIKFREAFGVPLESRDYFNRGLYFFERGEYESALKHLVKAIELKNDYVDAWNNRGVVLVKLGRYDEALQVYEKAIEIKHNYGSVWYNKACAYSLKGDKENTLKSLSKAIDLEAKFKTKAKVDADFKNLWADEDFKRIVS